MKKIGIAMQRKYCSKETCCCNCSHRAIDMIHRSHKDYKKGAYRGFVCLAPEFYKGNQKIVFSKWGEHGLCEMWKTDRPLKRRRPRKKATK